MYIANLNLNITKLNLSLAQFQPKLAANQLKDNSSHFNQKPFSS